MYISPQQTLSKYGNTTTLKVKLSFRILQLNNCLQRLENFETPARPTDARDTRCKKITLIFSSIFTDPAFT